MYGCRRDALGCTSILPVTLFFFLSLENVRKRCILYYACNDLSRIECREMWKIVENVEKCGHCGVNVEKCVGWHHRVAPWVAP